MTRPNNLILKKIQDSAGFGRVPLYYVSETDSTMGLARWMSREGYPDGTAVRTDFQRAGRGRGAERRWASARGKGLLMTVLLRQLPSPCSPESLPLRAGLAAARLLRRTLPEGRVRVKWPNDLILDDGKVGGVLCEGGKNGFLAGVGLNILQENFSGEGYRFPPSSLRIAAGSGTGDWSLDCLAAQFQLQFLDILGDSGEEWRQELEASLYWKGSSVSFLPGQAEGGGRPVRGVLAGIDDRGGIRLFLSREKGEQVFYAGEIKAGAD